MHTIPNRRRPGAGDLVAIPHDCATVETHISVLYFVGDIVYKIKKAVDLGFADFRSLGARHSACERELQLNRRLSPDVYLRVAEIMLPTGETEPAVVMRRLPSDRSLSALLERDEPSVVGDVRAIARIIAAFHARCTVHTESTAPGSFEAARLRWRRECEQLGVSARRLVDASNLQEIARRGTEFLEGRRRLIDDRLARGMVRDGHGDLQAADIFVLDDGPRIIDCLEFDSRLRIGDVLLDVAFLAMDLERLGAKDASAAFIAAYQEFSAESHPPPLLDFFVAYRALVRAKVAAIRWQQGELSKAGEIRGFVEICLAHLRKTTVHLVVVGGLPGSGKSTVARELSRILEAHYLSSDDVRDEIRDGRAVHPNPVAWGTGSYTAEAVGQVYAELLRRAELVVTEGFSVVVDASWSRRVDRDAVRRLAANQHAVLTELRCDVEDSVAQTRLVARTGGSSDADERIRRRMTASFEPWPEATPIDNGGVPTLAIVRATRAVTKQVERR